MRVTDDVDVIAELSSYVEYTKFSKLLRKLGFTEDSSEGAPICRWTLMGAKLDVMPTDERILGFSNKWFKSALSHAALTTFEGLAVRVVTPPYFLATKLAAYKGRGKGDFHASKDIEDVIALIDGRPTLVAEFDSAPGDVRRYVAAEIRKLLANREFIDAIAGHLPGDAASQSRIPQIVVKLHALSRSAISPHSGSSKKTPSHSRKP